MNTRLWVFKSLSSPQFSTTVYPFSVLGMSSKINTNISLRGLDAIQNHIPPVLHWMSSNDNNQLLVPANICYPFMPLCFCTCGSLFPSYLAPFVRSSSSFQTQGKCHFLWEALHALISCSRFMRWHLPLVGVISKVQSTNPSEGRKPSACAVYVWGSWQNLEVGHWYSPSHLCWVSECWDSHFLLLTSCNHSLHSLNPHFNVPMTWPVLCSRYLFNKRVFTHSKRLHHGTE